MTRGLALVLLMLLAGHGCDRPPPTNRNELFVLATIGPRHETSDRYDLDTLEALIRRIGPSVVLCEISPDRLDPALRALRAGETIADERLAALPEYTRVLLPLAAELGFEIVPCAAWSATTDEARLAGMATLAERDPQRHADARDALDWVATRLEAEGLSDDPTGIHTPAYDRIVAEGMRAYADLVDAELGTGGWEQVNRAHYALIDSALRSRAARGQRCLLMFSAWHKYWLRERLESRSDIILRPLPPIEPD